MGGEGQTDRQADRPTDRPTGRQADRQTETGWHQTVFEGSSLYVLGTPMYVVGVISALFAVVCMCEAYGLLLITAVYAATTCTLTHSAPCSGVVCAKSG